MQKAMLIGKVGYSFLLQTYMDYNSHSAILSSTQSKALTVYC